MEEVLSQLAKQVQNRCYGKHRGFVVDNQDPEQRARLKVSVPNLLGDQTSDWALPCLPFGGLASQGFFCVPEIGAQVWVEFEGGDLSYPIWVGTFWQTKGDAPGPPLDPPTTRVFATPAGHLITLEDADNQHQIAITHADGASIVLDPNGNVTITDKGGSVVDLNANQGTLTVEDANGNTLSMDSQGTKMEDANGNSVEMAASGIKVKGQQIVVEGTQVFLGGQGGEPVIKGQSFLQLFATHMHTAPPMGGPTSPPIPQGEMTTLSLSVMTK